MEVIAYALDEEDAYQHTDLLLNRRPGETSPRNVM